MSANSALRPSRKRISSCAWRKDDLKIQVNPIKGTGKTSIAKCLASEVNIPLLTLSCSSLLSPYLGEAEMNLKLFFEYARKNSTQECPGKQDHMSPFNPIQDQ